MRISKIILHNFRIYKGENEVQFPADAERNIFIVSGFNGYGKTTFLTSLVWCLYGKQMQLVDAPFKERITAAGGYKNYLKQCLNRLAKSAGETDYSVTVVLEDVEIPGVTVNEITIKRSFKGSTEKLDILIDGDKNELVKEVGSELFIQDFVLPKEIAKFFFFDAEKITSLAEMKTLEEKQQLNKAYSEVLGIKKYEDLRSNLVDIKHQYRKVSASDKEREELETLEQEVEALTFEKNQLEENLERYAETKMGLSKKSDELQEDLIRSGTTLSPEELQELKDDRGRLKEKIARLKEEFKELLDLAPFAMLEPLVDEVAKQLDKERNANLTPEHIAILTDRFEAGLKKMESNKAIQKQFKGKEGARVMTQIEMILRAELFEHANEQTKGEGEMLHAFSDEEYHGFMALRNQIKGSYKDRVAQVTREMQLTESAQRSNRSKLLMAESKENTMLVQKMRENKKEVDHQLEQCVKDIGATEERLSALENEFASKERRRSELAKNVKLSDVYVEKDATTDRLIGELDEFIGKIKERKRASLQDKIKESLNLLMHKSNFVDRVEVRVDNDITDIHLFNARNEEITKDDLSKGEQQLYATSILKALVEESNIEFPVFVDSPLQKFDEHHSENVIQEFYPIISKQVVVLPLLNKEITEREYDLMKGRVNGAYLIENVQEDASRFIQVESEALFGARKKLKADVLV